MCAAGLRIFQSRLCCFPVASFQKKLYNKYNSSPVQKRAYGTRSMRSGYAFGIPVRCPKKILKQAEQTSKLIYDNDPTTAAAVLSMAFVIVIYRIESISINSEK